MNSSLLYPIAAKAVLEKFKRYRTHTSRRKLAEGKKTK
jgi:hypothetical protein